MELPTSPALEGPRFGQYVLGARLATGGMGEVYLATKIGLSESPKVVVLKFLLPHLTQNAEAVQLFLDEARMTSRMQHPNIVEVYDLGEDHGRYFIAMELVRGVALSEIISALARAEERMPEPLILHIGRALCDALHHAHELTSPEGEPLNIIHRDATPHNVLVSLGGEVKITDFGIAKGRDSRTATQVGRVRGKASYLAPEQIEGRPVDRRADIYSAGLTLYHLATVQHPFTREGEMATFEAVLEAKARPLRELRPDLSFGLCAAIDRAMQRKPNKRFSTALELRRALPTVDASIAREGLGALVRRACGDKVSRLERVAEQTRSGLGATHGGLYTEELGELTGRTLLVGVPPDAGETGESTRPPSLPSPGTTAEPTGEQSAATALPSPGTTAEPTGEQSPAIPLRMTRPWRRLPPGRPALWLAGAGAVVGVGLVLAFALRSGADLPATSSEAGSPPKSAGPVPDSRRGELALKATAVAPGDDRAPAPDRRSTGPGAATLDTGAPLARAAAPARAGTPSGAAATPSGRNRPGPVEDARSGPGPTTRATVSPSPPARASSPPSARAPPARMGYLTVDARPWAQVEIGGKVVGETPLARLPLPAGKVEVRLKNPETAVKITRKVVITPGRETFLKADLK